MRQFQQQAKLQPVVRIARVGMLRFAGQQIAPGQQLVAAHLRIPAHAERIRTEGFGAAKGREIRRQELERGFLRDTLPVLIARQGQRARRVHHRDEVGRSGLHAVILI
jgi:hypothetical protein